MAGQRAGTPVRAAVAVVLAVVAVVFLASGGARGAVAETELSLSDDAGGRALFDSGVPLVPGRPRSACVSVAAQGAAGNDAVYVAARTVSGRLAAELRLRVEVGSGGGRGDCTGFAGATVYAGTLAGLAAVAAPGVATGWFPARAARRSFRVTVEVAPDAAQGATAQGAFVWRLVADPLRPEPEPTLVGPGAPATPGVPAVPGVPVGPTADPGPVPEPTGTPAPTGTAAPTPTAEPTASPRATPGPTVPFAPGDGGSDGGSGGSGGGGPAAAPGGSPAADAGADLLLTGPVAERVRRTAAEIARRPQPLLAAALLAAVFLVLQRQFDRRDPKLAGAVRTRRDAEIEFPDPLAGLGVRGSGYMPGLPGGGHG